MSNADPVNSNQEGSKFKRFLKRFGRRPSEENRKGGLVEDTEAEEEGLTGAGEEGTFALNSGGDKKSGTIRSRKGSKSNGGMSSSNSKKGRNDSIAGRFFQNSSNAPPLPTSNSQQQKNGSAAAASPITSPPLPINKDTAFGGTGTEGLANTLTIPPPASSSPAPQLGGLPRHDPIATNDLISSTDTTTKYGSNGVVAQESLVDEYGDSNNILSSDREKDASSLTAAGDTVHDLDNERIQNGNGATLLTSHSSYGSSPSQSRRQHSSDIDSAEGGVRGRDSLDNRTMDTGKSRASTKPTTLMSLETSENASFAPMAQIAQHRHGDSTTNNTTSPRVSSMRSNNSEGGGVYNSSIQFAPQAPLGRTISGTIVQLPGSIEDAPYMNVPTLSRPHPSNNPTPAGLPADNASMLTLASSTAAASITGGAASSREYSHATPSLGGARSIGGSLMGERRNSSDTYASVKALPPMSRRGSDSSTRTGKSVAASATGRSSAQAMMGPASVGVAAPGAPYDRISLHRTPSQRTIATQLSIPISTSNQVNAQDIPSITTTAPYQHQEQHDIATSEAMKAHVDQIAAA